MTMAVSRRHPTSPAPFDAIAGPVQGSRNVRIAPWLSDFCTPRQRRTRMRVNRRLRTLLLAAGISVLFYLPFVQIRYRLLDYVPSMFSSLVLYNRHAGPLTAQTLLAQPIDLAKCKVHKLATELVKSANTVVTAYYRLKSKHDDSNYDKWMRNFLSIQDPVIVFTQTDVVEKVKTMRQHALNRTVIIESKHDDLPIALLGQEFWERQLRIDPEARIHKSYQLFWIWLSKSWLVAQATRLNFFQSDFYFYSDIGSFRQPTYNDKLIVKYPEIVPPGTILWMAHRPPNPPPTKIWNDKRQRAHFYHSGSHGAGTAQSWLEFHASFASTLDAFIADALFVGEDQVVLQSTCLLFPRKCAYVRARQVNDNRYFGLRHVLHNGPESAVNAPGGRYQLWRPDGWNETSRGLTVI